MRRYVFIIQTETPMTLSYGKNALFMSYYHDSKWHWATIVEPFPNDTVTEFNLTAAEYTEFDELRRSTMANATRRMLEHQLPVSKWYDIWAALPNGKTKLDEYVIRITLQKIEQFKK